MLHTPRIVGLLLTTLGLLVHGQVLIGQTTGVTGAVAATVNETIIGAKLHLDAINALGGIGGEAIELITLDDAFDPRKAAVNARKLIEEHKVVALFMTRGTPHTEAVIPLLEQHGVPLIAPSTGAMVLHTPIRKKLQFVTLSNNASMGFVQLLGEDAAGVIVSQVLPKSLNFPLVREATRLAKARNMDDLSPAMLEGFAAAKVLVEALRRAGPKPTRERIQAALEGMHKFDLGGMDVSYSPTDHTGLDFADLSIIGTTGKFRR